MHSLPVHQIEARPDYLDKIIAEKQAKDVEEAKTKVTAEKIRQKLDGNADAARARIKARQAKGKLL